MYQYVGALHRAKESKGIEHARLSNNIQHGRRNNILDMHGSTKPYLHPQ